MFRDIHVGKWRCTEVSEEYKAPWEEPDIQLIVGIFGGTIGNIRNIGEVRIEINEEEMDR